MRKIRIKLVRLPNSVEEWEHELLLDTSHMIVSRFVFSGLSEPMIREGRTLLENGYTGILFEFVNEWYEIIKVRNKKGELVGYYCNINRPPRRFKGGYEVVDLFLDMWVFPSMEYIILDEDELKQARVDGLIDDKTERKARETLSRLVNMVKSGNFPPIVVNEYA